MRSLRRPRSGRTEVGSPVLAAPARGPASGSGAQSPRAPQTLKAKFLQAVAPTPREQGRNLDKPRGPAPRETLGREGCAWCFSCSCSSPGAPSPGNALPFRALPRPRLSERAARVPRGPHQTELANFVVGHKAEDVLDGYDGQRHQRVVLRQLVRSQRRGWGRLGPRLRGLGRGRWWQSLGRGDGRRGAAVAVTAASFLSHPLLRRCRHLGGLIPSPLCKGNRDTSGASLPSLELPGGAPGGGGGAYGVTGRDTLMLVQEGRREDDVHSWKGGPCKTFHLRLETT